MQRASRPGEWLAVVLADHRGSRPPLLRAHAWWQHLLLGCWRDGSEGRRQDVDRVVSRENGSAVTYCDSRHSISSMPDLNQVAHGSISFIRAVPPRSPCSAR